ncbi:MAG: hypothetical protein ACQEQG_09610 [Bacillota bacterium]
MSIGQQLLNVPFPEMVYNLASSIAKSQANLDRESIEILKIMGDKKEATVYLPAIKLDGGELTSDDENIETSMIGAGFQPTFYQFAETVIEVKMAITMTKESSYERRTEGEIKHTTTKKTWWGRRTVSVRSTPIDATYSSKYNFQQEGSSTIRTRLVPVPPNAFMQRLLDMKAEAMQMEFELKLREIELAIENKRDELVEE